jgi:hypothetical protein
METWTAGAAAIPDMFGVWLFVDEEFADVAEFPIIVPKFGPAPYCTISAFQLAFLDRFCCQLQDIILQWHHGI